MKVLKLTDGTKIRQLHRLEEGQKAGGIVVPMNNVFDAIKLAHGCNRHMKVQATYMKLKQVFWNIREQEVRHFISVCPSCNAKPPKKKAILGTKTPICSNCFGDHVQVDLIDIRCYRRKDYNSIMMNYIVVTKDHFSGFVALDSIPEKSLGQVANVLQKMFGHFGYPRILNTDNGQQT